MKKAHITHPELKVTLHLDIIGVKKNPNGQSYTQLGVLTRGTIIEVNVSELGLVTPGGKVVWGKYAQVRLCCPLTHRIERSAGSPYSLNCKSDLEFGPRANSPCLYYMCMDLVISREVMSSQNFRSFLW